MATAHTQQHVGRRRMLVPANLLLVALLVIHALRQDATVPPAAQVLGGVGMLTAVGSLALAVSGSRRASISTAIVGLSTAAGFIAVHVVPTWGPFSQPYPELGVDTVSWIGMLLPTLGAAVVGAIGLSTTRHKVPA